MALKNSLISNDVRQEFSVGASRALGLHKAEDIQHLDGTALLHIQSLLGHGSDWGVWQTPRNWFPGGFKAGWSVCIKDRINSLLPVNLRSVHVRECDSHQLLCQLIDDSLLMCIRYLILCRIGPMSLVNWRDSLDPSVIAQIAYSHLPKLAVIGIEKELNKANLLDQIANKRQNKTTQSISCFSLINYEDIDTLSSAISTKQCLKNEIKRMHAAFTRKLWGDVPDVRIDISKITQVRGHQLKQQQERTSSPHLPLPDEFVGEIGQKSYWLIKHLGPNLLCILNDFQEIWKDAAVRGIDARNLSETCRKYLSVYSWRDAEGVVIKNLPFDMRLNQRGSHSKKTSASLRFESQSIGSSIESSGMSEGTKSASWPPRGAAHIFGLTRALQGAHLFVIGLSTGARNGEALVMERGCVTRAPDGIPYANGKTYKLVRRHEGQLRDWALPALAEAAFEQQAKLICLVERLSPLSEISAVVNPSKVIPGIGLWFASKRSWCGTDFCNSSASTQRLRPNFGHGD